MLLGSEDPISVRKMALELGITPRIVRRSLAPVERWLESRGAKLVKKPRIGNVIKAPESDQANLAREMMAMRSLPLLLSPEERLKCTSLHLLRNNKPVLVREFQSIMNASRATVLRDLEKVEQWLEGHDLILVKKQNYGCKIDGPEVSWRNALVDFVLENVSMEQLLLACSLPPRPSVAKRRCKTELGRIFIDFVMDLEVCTANRIIAAAEQTAFVQLSDQDHIRLALYIAAAIWRYKHGCIIDESPTNESIAVHRWEHAMAAEIAARIDADCGIDLPPSEIAALTIQILESTPLKNLLDPAIQIPKPGETSIDMFKLADKILSKASLVLHPSIRVDEKLVGQLVQHLSRAIDQLETGVRIHNPLLEKVKEQYPRVYRETVESVKPLEELLGGQIPEEEIAYIAMFLIAALDRLSLVRKVKRLMVASDAGPPAASLLVSRLNVEFNGVEIVEVATIADLREKTSFEGIDLVISTVPIQLEGIPHVVVNTLIMEEDIQQIRKALEELDAYPRYTSSVKKEEHYGPSLAELLTEETIAISVHAEDWREAVESIGKRLVLTGAIENSYIEAMKDIIIEHGPYMVSLPGIALLHAEPQAGARRLSMALATLDEPVDFGHAAHDPVDIAIVICAIDSHSHLNALSQLQDLLEDHEAITEMRRAVQIHEIVNLVRRFSNDKA